MRRAKKNKNCRCRVWMAVRVSGGAAAVFCSSAAIAWVSTSVKERYRAGLVRLPRGVYHRSRSGSRLSIMADGGSWQDLAAEITVSWRMGELERARFVFNAFFTSADRADGQSCIDYPHWRHDHPYCWWCWRLLGSFESDLYGHPVCEECERWYEHAHCHWCWDLAEFWYLPAFHLPLCGRCSCRHLVGLGPPWYPNLLERQQLQVRWLFEAQARGSRYALPREVCDRVAGFLAELWRP